jgi:peptidoglycan hydrolase-like protein with peptidoglycan-binding domain
MSKRMLALATSIMMAAPLLAAPGFAQAPATPAPATPAPAAPATPAPAAPSSSAPAPAAPSGMKAMPMHPAGAAAGTHAGMRVDGVKKLQTALNSNGATLTVDGKMGPKTTDALKTFQQAHGLKVTGHPDKETRAALMK